MRKNETKARLKAGETVFGCFVRYPNASMVELLAYKPWDFIVFDGEHGTIQPTDCEHMVRAAELQEVTPIVRVTTNQPHIILRLMDTGAQGAHVPWVNSAAEAESSGERHQISTARHSRAGGFARGGLWSTDNVWRIRAVCQSGNVGGHPHRNSRGRSAITRDCER